VPSSCAGSQQIAGQVEWENVIMRNAMRSFVCAEKCRCYAMLYYAVILSQCIQLCKMFSSQLPSMRFCRLTHIPLLLKKSCRSNSIISHHPSPSPTVHANCVVRPYADAQTGCIVIAVAFTPQRPSLTLTPRVAAVGLNDQPCGSTAIVFLLHKLQLRSVVAATATCLRAL
jgi:hypothetical protein